MPVTPEGREIGIRTLFIARVVGTSPLRLEVLDARAQHVERAMNVVRDDVLGGNDPGTCGLALVPSSITTNLRALVSTLRFNDLVTGTLLMRRDPAAKNLSFGAPAVSELRKVTEPIPFFHPTPGSPNCMDRSGRLIDYISKAGHRLTIYNDGGIQYSTQFGNVFAREKLSADELKDLLGSFGTAAIDTLPEIRDEVVEMSGSRLTLLASRQQTFHTDPPDPRLIPVMERVNALTGRAMADTRFVLRASAARPIDSSDAANAEDMMAALRASTGRTRRVVIRSDGTSSAAEPLDIEKSPELASLYGPKYVWPRELGVRLADVPPDGVAIQWSEFEKHKPIYFALLNARSRGLTAVDGERLFEGVRLCQIDSAGHDSCGSK